MSEPQTGHTENVKTADPLEQFRQMRDTYMEAWAKATGEAVNTEAYAQGSGVMLDSLLAASAPFRDAQKKMMIAALEQLNMPSRTDFVSLAQRIANVEMLLDEIDSKVSEMHQLATKAASANAGGRPSPKSESKAKARTKPAARKMPVKAAKKGSR